MSASVRDLLRRAGADATNDPLDVIMGEDWGAIDLGRPQRLSLLYRAAGDLNCERGGSRGGGGRMADRRASALSSLRRDPEAMVKLVRAGGVGSAWGLSDQVRYLAKGGEAILERSDRYGGVALDASDLAEQWGIPKGEGRGADRTSHFVVSFPPGTDPDAAYLAGHDWAAEMFARGHYGDAYDYYTAHHTDRDHPHTHVVVNRRGLERGEWLKVSRRGPIDYDELRIVQVRVAAEHGIALQATPRLSRGHHDRRTADERQRIDARRSERSSPPAHTPASATRATVSLLLRSAVLRADAAHLRDVDPGIARELERSAVALGSGAVPPRALDRTITSQRLERANEVIMDKRSEIARDIERVDEALSTIPDGAARAPLEREAASIKGRAAPLLPERLDLRSYAQVSGNDYRGLPSAGTSEGEIARTIRTETHAEARSIVATAGLDPASVLARYETDRPAPTALADTWRREEIARLRTDVGDRPTPNRSDDGRSPVEDVNARMHERLAAVFGTGRERLAAHERSVMELGKGRPANDDARNANPTETASTSDAVRRVLGPNELEHLERGDAGVLAIATDDPALRTRIASRYLREASGRAEGAEREQLETALKRVREEGRGRSRAADRSRGTDDRELDL